MPKALEKWRDRFRHVLVDEYQDTNRAQYVLVNLLAAEHRTWSSLEMTTSRSTGFAARTCANILGLPQGLSRRPRGPAGAD